MAAEVVERLAPNPLRVLRAVSGGVRQFAAFTLPYQGNTLNESGGPFLAALIEVVMFNSPQMYCIDHFIGQMMTQRHEKSRAAAQHSMTGRTFA